MRPVLAFGDGTDDAQKIETLQHEQHCERGGRDGEIYAPLVLEQQTRDEQVIVHYEQHGKRQELVRHVHKHGYVQKRLLHLRPLSHGVEQIKRHDNHP